MKTTWRKLLVLMLSATMVLGFAVPTFAETEGGETADAAAGYSYESSDNFQISNDSAWRYGFPVGTTRTFEALLTYSYTDESGNTQYGSGIAPGHTAVWTVDAPEGWENYLTLTPSADGAACDVTLGEGAPVDENDALVLQIFDDAGNLAAQSSTTMGYFQNTLTEAQIMEGDTAVYNRPMRWNSEITIRPAIRRIENGVVTEGTITSCRKKTANGDLTITENGDGTWTIMLPQNYNGYDPGAVDFGIKGTIGGEDFDGEAEIYISTISCAAHDWGLTVAAEPQDGTAGTVYAECAGCGLFTNDLTVYAPDEAPKDLTDENLIAAAGDSFGRTYFAADAEIDTYAALNMVRTMGSFSSAQGAVMFAYGDFASLAEGLFDGRVDFSERPSTRILQDSYGYTIEEWRSADRIILSDRIYDPDTNEHLEYVSTDDLADGGRVIYGQWVTQYGRTGSYAALTLDAQGRIVSYGVSEAPAQEAEIEGFTGEVTEDGIAYSWTAPEGADSYILRAKVYRDGVLVEGADIETNPIYKTTRTLEWSTLLPKLLKQSDEGSFVIKAELAAYKYDQTGYVAKSGTIETPLTLTGVTDWDRGIDSYVREAPTALLIDSDLWITESYNTTVQIGIEGFDAPITFVYPKETVVTNVTLEKGENSNYIVTTEGVSDGFKVEPKEVSEAYLGTDNVIVECVQNGAEKTIVMPLTAVDESYEYECRAVCDWYTPGDDSVTIQAGEKATVTAIVHPSHYDYETEEWICETDRDVADQVEILWEASNEVQILGTEGASATLTAPQVIGTYASGQVDAVIRSNGIDHRSCGETFHVYCYKNRHYADPIVTRTDEGAYEITSGYYQCTPDGTTRKESDQFRFNNKAGTLSVYAEGNALSDTDAYNTYTGPITVADIEGGDWFLSLQLTGTSPSKYGSPLLEFGQGESYDGWNTWAPIRLDKAALALKTGDTAALTASYVDPAMGTPAEIAWSSSDESVASVGTDGTVTAVGGGTAVITAEVTVDHVHFRAQCTVTVESALEAPVITEIKNVSSGTKITWSAVEVICSLYERQ